MENKRNKKEQWEPVAPFIIFMECMQALIDETHEHDHFNQLVLARHPQGKSTFDKYGYPEELLNGHFLSGKGHLSNLPVTSYMIQLYGVWIIRKRLVNTKYTVQDTKALLIKKSPIIDETNTNVKKILNLLPSSASITKKDLSDATTQIDTNTNDGINDILKEIRSQQKTINEIKEIINEKTNLIDKNILNTQTIIIKKLDNDTEQIINGN